MVEELQEVRTMKTPEEIKKGLECCERHYVDLWENHCSECSYRGHEGCAAELHDDSIALILRLEKKIPRWISVKERLPEEG